MESSLICLFSSDNKCSKYFRNYKASGYFDLAKLTDLIDIHLSEKIQEKDLIVSRSKIERVKNGKICAFHRFNLGKDWITPAKCLHPEHNDNGKLKLII